MAATDFGTNTQYVQFFIFAVIFKLVCWLRNSYYQETALSSIPGPKWAAWSRLWIVKTLASGRSAELFVDVNKEYGKTPSHLKFNPPTVQRFPGSYRPKAPHHK